MDELPEHCCPGCGAAQRPFLRYPWYFCPGCVALACDGAGRKIVAGNTGAWGGFGWRYEDDKDYVECLGVICLIRGRPVALHEARFGGIVAEPVNSVSHAPRGFWRLTGKAPVPPVER